MVTVIVAHLNVSIKTNATTHALKLVLSSKSILGIFYLFGRIGLENKNQLFKKRDKKGALGTERNIIVFLWYYKSITFTTTRCSLQLTQRLLTFQAKRSFSRTSFIAFEFCKITARGQLIYWLYYLKMFAVKF